jgi:phosphoglycolate phosphatase
MRDCTIVFDLDGTLIDSAPDVCGALNRILIPYGRRPHDVEEAKEYLGQGARVLMKMALHKTGEVPAESVIEGLTSAFLADYAANPVVDTTVFPGVMRSLSELRDRGAKLTICTNKPSVTTAPVLESLELISYFGAVICPDHVEQRKPHGGHVRHSIDAVGGDYLKSIMVGDSENDIDAAINAGIPSIAVTFGYAHRKHDDLGATALIDHFDQLIETIELIRQDR